MRTFLRFFAILSFSAMLLPSSAFSEDFFGLPVRSLALVDDKGSPWPGADSLLPLLDLKPGDLLSREAVRSGIATLYLKRQFRDIRVETSPRDGGVAVLYRLFPVTIVDKVMLRGNHTMPDRTIQDALGVIAGKELREDLFPDLRTNIQTSYQAAGYYNVRVEFRPVPAPHPHRVHLYVYITEPKQTVIADIRFKGNTVIPAEDLLPVMENRKGGPLLTNVLFEKDLVAIQKKYADAGYPAAQPGPVSMSFQGERVFLEIGGAEGPKVHVAFSGNRRYCEQHFPDILVAALEDHRPPDLLQTECDKFFRSMLLIGQEHDVSDTVLESSADKIRNAYRDEGYPDAKVSFEKREADGTLDILFSIVEGRQVTIDSITVEGNKAFASKNILGMMDTRPAGLFRVGMYREDVLDRDKDYIADQYAAAGYLSAEVKTQVARLTDGGNVAVVIRIQEGRKTVMGGVSFEGNAALSSAELAATVLARPGMPFSDRVVEEDRYRILTAYARKGYLYARVEAEKRSSQGNGAAASAGNGDAGLPETVHIVFHIAEDKPVMIGKVILRGNAYTRDHVILRELEPKPGEPYNYESILQSQQRVYRYGYFSQARYEPVHPAEKEYRKDMLFTVEERPAGAVEFGVGYGDLDRLRGFVEVSHRNLRGTARYASLRFEGSDILKRAALTYQEPWIFGRPLDSQFTLAWSDRKNINQDTREVTYQTRKTSAAWGVEKKTDRLKTSLTYQFENVDNYNVKPEAQLSFEDSGRVLVSSLNPAVLWDRRDDPFNPAKGGIHGIVVKEALSELGSQADFTKATVQTSWFFSPKERVVFALSGRCGMAWPHRQTEVVPIHERFFLGGGTTVRGYTQDSVGPYSIDTAGERVPTGGSSMVQLNAELRVNSSGGVGMVLFSDAGNVWVDRRIRLDDLRASYGTGLRYQTPVGPLRIDYGQKIHRRPGESPGELHFNIGHAF